MVKSEQAYSPQNYVEAVTGRRYLLHSDSIVGTIDEIVSNEIDVVLVELTGEDDDGEWKTVYRWFEVPVGFRMR